MRVLNRTTLTALVLGSLTLLSGAQQQGQPGGGPEDPGGLGENAGSYKGPGDTTPTTPSGGGNTNPTGPTQYPVPTSTPTATPGYAEGLNPLDPRIPHPLLDPNNPSGANTPANPASRPSVQQPNSWKLWWHYNRWSFLPRGLQISSSGAGGFFIGRGERDRTSTTLTASRGQMQDVVQPALIQALLKGGRPELEIYSLHALAKMRGIEPSETHGGFMDMALRSLKSGNQEVAEKAALALGVRGEDRFAPWLVAILKDSPEGRALMGRQRIGLRLRTFAAYGLGLLGERSTAPETRAAIYDALVESLWLERVEVQAACLTAIGLTAMPADDEFVGTGSLFEGRTRVDQVLELLSFFEDPEQPFVARSQAPTAIARLLDDSVESLRGRAAYAFLVASGPHSKELREVQNAAVIALGRLGRSGGDPLDDQILEHLEHVAYKSKVDRSTRYFAMIALAEAGRRRNATEEPYAAVAHTRKTFLKYLGRSRGETQAWTALGLGVLEETAGERGELPDPDSGKALRHVFSRSRSPEVVGALAIALGMLKDREAVDLLSERMLGGGEEHVIGYSALALGMIGSPGSIQDIRRVLTDGMKRPFVVEYASIALALLGDQEVGSRLYSILEDTSRPEVQSSIASAMGWVKDPRPLGDLARDLVDARKNDVGRAWTAVAIGRICDDDPWPWVGRLSADAHFDVWLPTLIEPGLQNGLLDMP